VALGCSVEFPFLVLLISGGHCLLALVRGVDDFLLIGKGLDEAPGDAFDKVGVFYVNHIMQCKSN